MIVAWVVGAGGLLGTALRRQLEHEPEVRVLVTAVSWSEPALAVSQLESALDEWLSQSDADAFELYWAAGAAVTSSTDAAVDIEVGIFERVMQALDHRLRERPASRPVSVIFTSSAGGVYAGSAEPPFSESTAPRPIVPYGVGKLRMEDLLMRTCEPLGVHAFVCRVANLYGEGQSLGKQQGFISHLCRSYVMRVPMSIYVSLDTLRDYLHVDDAARMMVAGARLQRDRGDHSVVKNIASLDSTSIAQLLQYSRAVFKRRTGVIVASSPYAAGQVRDLRLTSEVYSEIDVLPKRTLLVGMDQIRRSLIAQLHTSERRNYG